MIYCNFKRKFVIFDQRANKKGDLDGPPWNPDLCLNRNRMLFFWGVFGNKKKATESFDSIALVPHIGVEPMIYCVRGSCPGPLDECGSL